ncbi:zinc knuckle protein, putative (macronuclear) [Tetrahymena thermophila SB210]|uniref:Zinc knuckle protein, putative n=1 Tax=Tetrahymena thermophila (strain SB210) TaxID=312017 RepID=Q22BI2_TETTS|nr:zinc knuckle protein, putative [Tetrahymena thermophila SB210]EAR82622.1 zinc knuckle protein, putative [Tetrahymena thermophila SB210]|eukprot:XP_001030285.1 zinc knuckle protein, putative [Tetrahymena thermophila SB210]
MKANQLLDAIKSVDIYGVPIGVNFKNEQTYKTLFGAMMSISIFILFGFQCYLSCQALFNKSDPQIITSEQYVRNPQRMDFDKVQQTVMMGFSTPQSQFLNDPTIFQVSAVQSSIRNIYNQTSKGYDKIQQNTPLRIRPCTIDDVKVEKVKNYFSSLKLNQLFCFDDNQEVYIEGDYSGDIYSRVDVYFTQCVNSTSNNQIVCKPQKQIDKVLSNVSFLVYMMDKILDPSNFDSPFDIQGFNLQAQASNQQSQQYTAYFENYYIDSDIGIISQEIEKKRDFIFKNTDTTIIYNKPSLVMQFTMRPYKNKQMFMLRKYVKFTDLISQLGGFLKFLTLIGFILSHPFAKLYLNKEIINSVFDFQIYQSMSDQQDNADAQKINNQNAINSELISKEKNVTDQIQSDQLNLQIGQKNAPSSEKSKLKIIQEKKRQSIFQYQQQHLLRQSYSDQLNSKILQVKSTQEQNKLAHNSEDAQNVTLGLPKSSISQIITSPLIQPISKNTTFNVLKLDSIKQKCLSHTVLSESDAHKNDKQSSDNLQLQTQMLTSIQKLLNPIKNILRLSPFEYISYFITQFSKNMKQKKILIEQGVKKVQNRLDIQNILNKLQEIEKLKLILLNEDQIKLFEILPRPVLKNDGNSTSKHQSNQFYNTVHKTYEQKVDDAYGSLIKILSKNKKSQRDIQLIQLLDENIYKAVNSSGLLTEKESNQKQEQSKYNYSDEILEENNQIKSSNNSIFFKQKSRTSKDFDENEEDSDQLSPKSQIPEENKMKNIYQNFYRQLKRNQSCAS